MKIWISETGDRRGFLAYLRDTYDRKPIRVCEYRSLMNAFIINLTASRQPGSEAFSKIAKTIEAVANQAIAALPADVTVILDWYNDESIETVDYFIMHEPKDSDAIMQVEKPEVDASKVQIDLIQRWKSLTMKAPEKLIVLKYEERIRDILDIVPEGEGGVQLRLSVENVASHKYARDDAKRELAELARILS